MPTNPFSLSSFPPLTPCSFHSLSRFFLPLRVFGFVAFLDRRRLRHWLANGRDGERTKPRPRSPHWCKQRHSLLPKDLRSVFSPGKRQSRCWIGRIKRSFFFFLFFFCGSPNRSRRRIRATAQRFFSVARPFLHPGRIASGMSEFRAARTRLLECVDRNGGEKMANNEEAAGADTTKKERNAPQNCPEHCIAGEALDWATEGRFSFYCLPRSAMFPVSIR